MRSLQVYVDRTCIGALSEANDLWVFDYDKAWAEMERSFDLSPALPREKLRHADGGTERPVQWYFDNLLPEELLRQSIAKEAGIKDHEDAFALLEYLGAESAGSLTLLPPGAPLPDEFALKELSDAELSRRIQALPKQTLSKGAPKRMSLAGAQHKLLVVVKGDSLYEPVGATPSTYILKPEHTEYGTYPASVFNEFLTMRLADAARLETPAVLMKHVPEPIYLIERFDREVKNEGSGRRRGAPLEAPAINRLHVIDGCQLLNKARTFKHSGATLTSLVKIIERTTNKIQTRTRLFRWLVFNVLVANDDCHLKNLSFHVNHEGIWLAPHYDLLATGVYYTKAFADEHATWDRVRMAFALPGAKTFGEVTLKAVLAAGQFLGLPERVARRLVNEVTGNVAKEFAQILAEHEQQQPVDAERAAGFALEARLLRVVDRITLPEMLQRLSE
ncbi:HipA domain-containing protein [Roseateles sp. NT4]|uniref:HipA domain-containing protein n=1 Tax=Roseateles sp. NT4 TaxID=3453715 RepID=UPI003EECADD5